MTDPTPTPKQEPIAVWQMVVGPALMAVSLFFHLTPELQGAVDAAILAAMGVIAMFGVDWRRSVPLLSGLAKAVFSLVAGLGLHWPDSVQAGVMALIAVAVSAWGSSQVIAKPSARLS